MAPRESRVETHVPPLLNRKSAQLLLEQVAKAEAERAAARPVTAHVVSPKRISSVDPNAPVQPGPTVDVLVPMEFDARLRQQPTRSIRLRAVGKDDAYQMTIDGTAAKQLPKDPSGPVWLLRFEQVPVGLYEVELDFGASGWVTVASTLRVAADGVTLEDEAPPALDADGLGTPDDDDDDVPPLVEPDGVHGDFNALTDELPR